jgi:hypothetical protein
MERFLQFLPMGLTVPVSKGWVSHVLQDQEGEKHQKSLKEKLAAMRSFGLKHLGIRVLLFIF